MENFILVLSWVFMVIGFLIVAFGFYFEYTHNNNPIVVALKGRYEAKTGKFLLVGIVCACYLISYYFG